MKVISYILFLLTCALSLHVNAMDNSNNASTTSSLFEQMQVKQYKNLEGICAIYALIKEKIIGEIIFTRNEIINLKVEPQFQCQGIGSVLFIEALDQIKAEGFSYAWWHADKSIPYYMRFGAKLDELPDREDNDEKASANMYFRFEIDGDPLENLKKFKQQFIQL